MALKHLHAFARGEVPRARRLICRRRQRHRALRVEQHLLHFALVPRERPQTLARFRVIDAGCAVVGGAGEHVAAQAEANVCDSVRVVSDRRQGLARADIPQHHGLVKRARDDQVAAVVERGAGDLLAVAHQLLHAPTGHYIPQGEGAVKGGGEEKRASHVELDVGHRGGVARQCMDLLARDNVPDLRCVVHACGGEQRAHRVEAHLENVALVAAECVEALPRLNAPELASLVQRAGGHFVSKGVVERHGVHYVLVAAQHNKFFARHCVGNLASVVVASRRQPCAALVDAGVGNEHLVQAENFEEVEDPVRVQIDDLLQTSNERHDHVFAATRDHCLLRHNSICYFVHVGPVCQAQEINHLCALLAMLGVLQHQPWWVMAQQQALQPHLVAVLSVLILLLGNRPNRGFEPCPAPKPASIPWLISHTNRSVSTTVTLPLFLTLLLS
eukprot:m.60923 g.60923  ORF g.60923 m.60923 type:complete len:444 (-) comp13696_c0_seq1:11-1342(-)